MKLIISLLSMALILGCSDFDNFYQGKRVGSKDLTGSSIVVAKIGGETITKEDLIKSLNGLPPRQRINYLSSPERLREYLDSVIKQMVLYKEAEKMSIDKREKIKESLQNYERRLLIQALSQDIMDHQISEEEIKKYYEQNPNSFKQIRVSEIFIKANPEQGISKDEARTIAWLVENKIFNLKIGEISDPIETKNGFIIIKVTEDPKSIPLDQVIGQIQVELRKKTFSDYTKKLREQIGVEIFEDNLKKISENGL